MFFLLVASSICSKYIEINGIDPDPVEPPKPTPSISATPPIYERILQDDEVAAWLIACTVVVCVIIVALVIVIVVMCFKLNKGEIYSNENQEEKDTVEIRSIYSVQKSARPTTAQNNEN